MNPLMSQPCQIQLLGGLRVEQAGRVLTRFPTYKTAALLAYLAYHPNPQSRELLIELFWPDGTPERGRNNLSTTLSSLRNQLEPPGVPAGAVLVADRHQVNFNPVSIQTDVHEFEQALQAVASAPSDTQRAEHLQAAADLYKGELLPGYYEDWILPERQRLAEAYLQALRRLIRFLVKRKQLPQAIDYSLRILVIDPLREEAYRDLMKLYVAVGQPSAALQQYRQLEQILQRDLNAQPSSATRQVAREIETLLQQPAAPAHLALPARPKTEEGAPPPALPSGTVTFLLTDIAGSVAQSERSGEAFRQALSTHHALLREQFTRYGGQEFKEVGDAFLVAFERASDAILCAIASQRALSEQRWHAEVGGLRVRMALHTGEAAPEAGDYHCPALNRASRLLSAAHGGQVLCSETSASLLRRALPGGVDLHDLGLYRLRDLPTPEHLFQVEYLQMPQREFPAPNADAGFTSTLPLSFTRFFGRGREQAQLQEWLLEGPTRLVTLTGMGGTGKTRLALEVGRSLEEAFGGAVWFVGLADIADDTLIVSTIAGALRLTLSPLGDPMDQVVAALSRRPSLLILDNFEQLVEGGSPQVQALLSRVPLLSLLVTSRQTLGLEGEREFALAPLMVPGGVDTPEQLCLYESVQLFIDRAQTVKPNFQVSSQNAAAVATLCMRLEGIPLAIELAAARSQVLTPAQILAQLENRFDFLSSRRRDVSERHRTLRAAMEWSYRLLSPQLQRFFARLSVFRGGWTTEAVEAVCEEPLALDAMAQLRECSLVLAEERGEEIRFQMLETLREYAESQLEEEEGVRLEARHIDYHLRLAEQIPYKIGPDQALRLSRQETEYDNLRAALDRSMQALSTSIAVGKRGEENSQSALPAEVGLRLCTELQLFWWRNGHLSEGRQWYARALQRTEDQERTQARAKALSGAGELARMQGDYMAARAYHEESLAIRREIGDRGEIASSLDRMGLVAHCRGDNMAALAYFEQSLAIRQESGDREGIADSLLGLGNVAFNRGDTATAQEHYEAILAIKRDLGDRGSDSGMLNNMGLVAAERGDYAAARKYLEESLAILREIGSQRDIPAALGNMGVIARDQGDYIAARAYHEESLAILGENGDRGSIAGVLVNLGHLAQCQGDDASARSYYEESLSIFREIGDRYFIAYSLNSLGNVASGQGDYATAREYLVESLSIRRETDNRGGIAASLEEFARLAAAQGQMERAARLWGAAEALREQIGAHRSGYERKKHERSLAQVHETLDEKTFRVAWLEGLAMTIEQALAYALGETQGLS